MIYYKKSAEMIISLLIKNMVRGNMKSGKMKCMKNTFNTFL